MTGNVLNPDKWVDRYADYLFNYTIVRVNDREVANDIISETFLAGLNSMKNFKGEASERTWLISILKRKIIDYYRKINSKKGQAEVKISLPKATTMENGWRKRFLIFLIVLPKMKWKIRNWDWQYWNAWSNLMRNRQRSSKKRRSKAWKQKLFVMNSILLRLTYG